MRKSKEQQKAVLRARLKTYVTERILKDMSLSQLLTLSNYADRAERLAAPFQPMNERALHLLTVHAILNSNGLLTALLTKAEGGDIEATLNFVAYRHHKGQPHLKPLLDVLVMAVRTMNHTWGKS